MTQHRTRQLPMYHTSRKLEEFKHVTLAPVALT